MAISKTQVAQSVPFDNATNGFVSTDAQAAIEEIRTAISASPGFSFGRSGAVTRGTYLQNETVPSNVSGRWVYVNSAVVTRVFISNELIGTYSIDVTYHDGNAIGETLLGTVTITSARGAVISVNWPVPTNKQIAVRVSNSSTDTPKNIVCGLQLTGTP